MDVGASVSMGVPSSPIRALRGYWRDEYPRHACTTNLHAKAGSQIHLDHEHLSYSLSTRLVTQYASRLARRCFDRGGIIVATARTVSPLKRGEIWYENVPGTTGANVPQWRALESFTTCL